MGKRMAFTICHYAEEVTNDTTGFLEKNRDLLHLDTIELLSSWSCPLPQAFASTMLVQSEKPVVGALHKSGGCMTYNSLIDGFMKEGSTGSVPCRIFILDHRICNPTVETQPRFSPRVLGFSP